MLRHADVQALLTVPRFLANDYLERLEAAAPSLAASAPALHARELPYLRHVFVSGDPGERRCASRSRALEAAADAAPAIDAEFLAEVESCVAPADPLVLIYSSGSTAEPKGAVHSHGSADPPRLQPEPVPRHARRATGCSRRCRSSGSAASCSRCSRRCTTGAFLLCEEAFEPGETLELLERERATDRRGWPHYSKAMAEHPTFAERDLSSIRAGNLYAILPEPRARRTPSCARTRSA